MSIKSFISNFQDELFIRKSLLHTISETKLVPSYIEAALNQTEGILNDLKQNVEFLDKESKEIYDEVVGIFDSIENKLDKIDRYAEAFMGINSTYEDAENILTIHPYLFDHELDNWEAVQKCYMITPESSYKTFKPFSNIFTDAKGLVKFSLESDTVVRYIQVVKLPSTNVTTVTYLDSSRKQISKEQVQSNLSDSSIVLSAPINTRIVLIEYVASNKDNIEIVPLTFRHKKQSTISLEEVKYDYGTSLNFLVKHDIPFGCFAQILLTLVFTDINDNIIHHESVWYSIDNDGNVVLPVKDVKNETILKVWKENLFKDLEDGEQLSDTDLVLCKPTFSKHVYPNTENSFKTDVKHAKYISIVPTLYMYSLYSTINTPRLFSITGVTRNESSTF